MGRGFVGNPGFFRAAVNSHWLPRRLFRFDRIPVWIRLFSGADRASDRRSLWLSVAVRATERFADPPQALQSLPAVARPARYRRYRPSSFSRNRWTAGKLLFG